jgi:hypothetical protein
VWYGSKNTEAVRNVKTLLAGMLGVCWMAACNGTNVKPGDADYPRENPKPTQFLLLHGTIDPSLHLDFRIGWHADSPQCQYVTSRVEGAYAWYTASSPLPVPLEGSRFSVRIPIDGVLPGRCRWRFGGVMFGGVTGYRTALITTNSYALLPGQSPNGTADLNCKWVSIAHPAFSNPNLECRWANHEDPNASVHGGILWWHPEASELEVHITIGAD